MSEDWAAVATAITNRLRELGWTQRQLAERSHVSQAVVRELQHHTVERRRSPRTLAALSTAMHWHPNHLDAVLHGQTPPEADLPADTAETLWSRLESLEERVTGSLHGITTQLDALTSDVKTIIDQLPQQGRAAARRAHPLGAAEHEAVGRSTGRAAGASAGACVRGGVSRRSATDGRAEPSTCSARPTRCWR